MKNVRIYSKRNLVAKTQIHLLIKNLSRNLNFKVESLEINFVDAESILKINKLHLKHNYTTDIITFNYANSFSNLDGEIFISLEDAIYNAKKFNVKIKLEIFRLIIHGILHLLGYNDQKESEKKIMKQLENKLLSSNKFILL